MWFTMDKSSGDLNLPEAFKIVQRLVNLRKVKPSEPTGPDVVPGRMFD